MKIKVNQVENDNNEVKVFFNAFQMGREAALKAWKGR